MKPKTYKLIGLLLLFCFSAMGQTNPSYFYYYKNQKKPLTLNTKYAYIVITPNISTKEQLVLYLGEDVEVTRFGQNNIGKRLNTATSTTTRSSEYWAEVQLKDNVAYTAQLNQLKQSPFIELVAPYFKNETEDKIGLSNYFYVKLRNENDLSVLLDMATSSSTQIVGQNKFMPLWYTLKCTGNSNYNALEAANVFYESGYFATAEPDLMVDILLNNNTVNTTATANNTAEELVLVPNDPLYTDQWGLNNTGQNGGTTGIDIDAEDAWDITTGDPSIVVAVLDHGFEMNHPDLQNNVFGQGYDTESDTTPAQVLGAHGTACAGIIGAVQDNNIGVSGVAPNTSLMSISNSLVGNPDSRQARADGINWAWQNGADIISNSWGSGVEYQVIDDAIDNALTNGRGGLGTVIVFATGNDYSNTISYPANSNPAILAVGAINSSGEKASFSNFGNELDVITPGVSIPTTDRQGDVPGDGCSTPGDYNPWACGSPGNYPDNNYTRWFNGTSAACPHVAGVAALVLSVNPMLTVQEVNNIIEQSATKVREDLYTYSVTGGRPNGTWNNEMGYGLVNAHAAVLLAQDCAENLVIIQDVLNGESDNQEAQQTITATNTIFDNGSAIYHAGDQVVLNPGFFTEVGATFHGYVEGCSGLFQARSQHEIKNTKVNEWQAPTIDTDAETITNSKLVIFPNPSEGIVTFQFYTGEDAKVALAIYDLAGKLQVEKQLNYQQEGQQLVEADLSTLPSGTYLYKLVVDKKPFSGKIIKK